jgi:hypothetical protein
MQCKVNHKTMALVKTNRSKRQKTLEVIVLNTLPHWTSYLSYKNVVFLINYCMGVSGYYPVSGYFPVSGHHFLLTGIR